VSESPRNFDRLARCYRVLEYLALGRDLERARFSLLPHLKDCRHILILGEGDGRCLERLIAIAPDAQIDCLDISAVMLARTKERLRETPHHVNFQPADILATELPPQHYDAVITCFFLDCFTNEQASKIISKISRSLRPTALWLWADFTLPDRGLSRIRAKIWLAILYTFFRWQTNLQTCELPESEALIHKHGFQRVAQATFQWGLLRSSVYRITTA
jgi:ubiquinone/menaquinone biosynthesis C-methylase UbiE